MKILHVTTIGFHSHNKNSGVPSVLKPLSEEQNKIDGVEARVLSIRYNEDEYFDTLGDMTMEQYIDYYKPDIVLFHTIYFVEYVKFAKILKKKHIPFVVEPHGSFGKQAMQKSRLKKWLANHTLFRSLIKDSEVFIYTNSGEKANSIYPKKKSVVIPNGVSEEVVTHSTNLKGSIPIFYFLGRFSIHHKGLDYLLDALKILESKSENITVYFYGIGDDQEMKFMQDGIRGFRNVKAVLKGTIFGDEKLKALEEANILILTSRYEGSPMTVLDALSYGNPCLVTPGTNVADEIYSNNIGWTTKLDANSIAETIIKAKNDYLNNVNVYTQRCKAYVSDNYLWSKIAKQSVVEYEAIIRKFDKQ